MKSVQPVSSHPTYPGSVQRLPPPRAEKPAPVQELPFKLGRGGKLSPAVDFSRYLEVRDPKEDELHRCFPLLAGYLRTGQFGEMSGVHRTRIRYAVFAPPPGVPVRRVVNIVPGRAESIAKYAETLFNLRHLRAQGIAVAILDSRGQGFSEHETAGDKGDVRRFDDYVEDERRFTGFLKRTYGDATPRVLVAHSMGGAIAARLLESHPHEYERTLLMSPMLDIHSAFPNWLERVSSWLGALVAPTHYSYKKGPYRPLQPVNSLTSSVERTGLINEMHRRFPSTKLGGPTWRWFHESVKVGRHLLTSPSAARKLRSLDLEVWSAGQDTVVEPAAHQRWSQRVGARLCNFPDAKHELLLAPDEIREPVMQGLKEFITR